MSGEPRSEDAVGSAPIERPTSRVLLVGPGDRILLFRGMAEEGDQRVWFAPGGGVHPGESHEQAALRELREEVGLDRIELGPWVWNREHVVSTARGLLRLRERYFVARTPSLAVDTSGFEPGEARVVTAHRWMSVPDIAAIPSMGHLVAPRRLAELLPPILAGDLPAGPIDVGI